MLHPVVLSLYRIAVPVYETSQPGRVNSVSHRETIGSTPGNHWFHTDETDSFIQLEQMVSYGWNDEFHTVETSNKKDTYRSAHQSAVNARPISANKSSIFSRPTERRIVFWLISILCLCSSVKVP